MDIKGCPALNTLDVAERASTSASLPDAVGRASTSASLPDWHSLRGVSCWSTDSFPEIGSPKPTSRCLDIYHENQNRLLQAAQSANVLLQAELDAEREKCHDACMKLAAAEAHASKVMDELRKVKQQFQEQTEACATLRMALRREHELEITKNIRDAKGEPWRSGDFSFVKTLESAPRNKGFVDLMKFTGGGQFAVKRMPISLTKHGYDMFIQDRAGETENPWVDVGTVKYLNKMGYPYACKLLGVFQDSSEMFIVSSFATEGDLFYWSRNCPLQPGFERDALVRPIVKQVSLAVSALHDFGIAHCDLSAENILITREETQLAVKLIDFSMSVAGKSSLVGCIGKASYQAPESHLGLPYSPFMHDLFALGVVTFVMAAANVPWMSTRPRGCKRFAYAREHGLRAYLKKVKRDTFSPTFIALLETTLAFEPALRGDVAQFCSSDWVNEDLVLSRAM
eukprot:TRINITY_DN8895_c0_g1_i1.p1 TRINITY_DN8895_c0_g1~~TRINITY_DN8895_c0_g1_i1.p1  ORF type:complete len:471 (-),score=72.69 TRINITY_DN8895_c0_g1_i1:260-1624(-)